MRWSASKNAYLVTARSKKCQDGDSKGAISPRRYEVTLEHAPGHHLVLCNPAACEAALSSACTAWNAAMLAFAADGIASGNHSRGMRGIWCSIF